MFSSIPSHKMLKYSSKVNNPLDIVNIRFPPFTNKIPILCASALFAGGSVVMGVANSKEVRMVMMGTRMRMRTKTMTKRRRRTRS